MRLLTALFLLVFYGLLSGSMIGQHSKNYELQSKPETLSLKDTYSYTSADSMFRVAPVSSYTNSADFIFSSIKKALNNEQLPENKEVWNLMLQLEPYRKNVEALEKTEEIAKQVALEIRRFIRQNNVGLKATDAKKATLLYHKRDLNGFMEKSRSLLLHDPGNLDIRNNLALALMHSNYDLFAFLELKTILETDSSYLMAWLNITTVYERLGMRDAAQSTAFRLLAKPLLPDALHEQVVFNAAWYYYIQGKYAQADSLLAKSGNIIPAANSKKFALHQLCKQSILEQFTNQPFINIGTLGKFGYSIKGTFSSLYLCITAFLFVTCFIILFVRYIQEDYSVRKLFLWFLASIAFLALVDFIAWGFPVFENRIFYFSGGLMGRLGLNIEADFFNGWIIASTIAILVILIIIGTSFLDFKDSVGHFFLQLSLVSLILGIFHLLVWGIPTALNYGYLIGYSLLPFIILVALGILAMVFSN